MKYCFYFLLASLILTSVSCKKSDSSPTNQETKITITVKDGTGATMPNITVYQINEGQYNAFGADPFYKDQQSVTAASGIATFIIDPIFFNTGGQKTFYFFIKYTVGGTNKTKVFGTTLSKGETKSGDLIMD